MAYSLQLMDKKVIIETTSLCDGWFQSKKEYKKEHKEIFLKPMVVWYSKDIWLKAA